MTSKSISSIYALRCANRVHHLTREEPPREDKNADASTVRVDVPEVSGETWCKLRCYLCDTPKRAYGMVNAFSELICRGCVNYEGSDRIEALISGARLAKRGGGTQNMGVTAPALLSPMSMAPAADAAPSAALVATEVRNLFQFLRTAQQVQHRQPAGAREEHERGRPPEVERAPELASLRPAICGPLAHAQCFLRSPFELLAGAGSQPSQAQLLLGGTQPATGAERATGAYFEPWLGAAQSMLSDRVPATPPSHLAAREPAVDRVSSAPAGRPPPPPSCCASPQCAAARRELREAPPSSAAAESSVGSRAQRLDHLFTCVSISSTPAKRPRALQPTQSEAGVAARITLNAEPQAGRHNASSASLEPKLPVAQRELRLPAGAQVSARGRDRPPNQLTSIGARKTQPFVANEPMGVSSSPAELKQMGVSRVAPQAANFCCLTCGEPLEDRHFVQCPSVPNHKYCFNCSKISILRQRSAAARTRNFSAEKISCPSGDRCLLAAERTPWVFMKNEIDTIFRESSRPLPPMLEKDLLPNCDPLKSTAPLTMPIESGKISSPRMRLGRATESTGSLLRVADNNTNISESSCGELSNSPDECLVVDLALGDKQRQLPAKA